MIDLLLDHYPIWVVALLILGGCIAARWIGVRLRKKLAPTAASESDRSDAESYISGAVFGLLAFMLALTFSMSLDRFDARRGLVLDEANALSTTYMRLSLFDEPQASQTRALMREYAHTRIAPGGMWNEQTDKRLIETRAARDRLWVAIRAALLPWRETDFASNILEPMNEAFDLGNKRELMARAHVPTRILEALLIYLLVSAAVLGFLIGNDNRRRHHATSLVLILYTLGLALVIDIDRPQAGGITVSQKALEELVASMDRNATQPAATP